MKQVQLVRPGETLRLLCLGAHSDDCEIGAGGTILGWIAAGVRLDVHWVVLSGDACRAAEARASAGAVLEGAMRSTVEVAGFRDAYFPYQGAEIKEWMCGLSRRFSPDLIFTHNRDDAHQDHRLIADLTYKAFRDHMVLEYEVPKWDGDLGRPTTYVPMTAATLDRKLGILERHFQSQRSKDWFDGETFRGLARLRGMECRAPERYAEAFYIRKLILT